MIPRHFKQFLAVALMLIGLVVASQSLYAQCVTPPSGMVDWWPLDEAVGSTANDIAGSFNNSGTWMNSPTPVSGKVAGALCFDGVNDYVQVLTHSEVNFGTGDLTIDAWVKRDVASTQSPPSVIVDKRDISGIGYSLSVSWGRLVFTMCTTNYVTTTSPVPADGLWHFVAVTVDRVTNVGQFYCDGSPLDTFTPSCNLTNDFDLKIGEGYLGSNQRWRGCIDELEFFNRVLTPLEVHDIWAADSAGKCRGGVGGFKYWDLDRDGTHDLGEPGLQYWTIEAYAPGQSVRSNWSVTDAAGSYYMTLGTNYTNPATYYIREVPQSGWTQTLPLTAGEWVTVMPNVTYLGPDFLNYYQDSTERTSQTVSSPSLPILTPSSRGLNFFSSSPPRPFTRMTFPTISIAMPSGIFIWKTFESTLNQSTNQ